MTHRLQALEAGVSKSFPELLLTLASRTEAESKQGGNPRVSAKLRHTAGSNSDLTTAHRKTQLSAHFLRTRGHDRLSYRSVHGPCITLCLQKRDRYAGPRFSVTETLKYTRYISHSYIFLGISVPQYQDFNMFKSQLF